MFVQVDDEAHHHAFFDSIFDIRTNETQVLPTDTFVTIKVVLNVEIIQLRGWEVIMPWIDGIMMWDTFKDMRVLPR